MKKKLVYFVTLFTIVFTLGCSKIIEDKETGLKFSSPVKPYFYCKDLHEKGLIWRNPNDYEKVKFKSILFLQDIKKRRCVSGKELFFSDKISGLTWSKAALKTMDSVLEAKEYCENLKEGDYNDWRLPNIDELRTLIQNCSTTEIGGKCKISEKTGKLSNEYTQRCNLCKDDYSDEIRCGKNSKSKFCDSNTFWSSSVADRGGRWGVNFQTGNLTPVLNTYGYVNFSCRCVRGEFINQKQIIEKQPKSQNEKTEKIDSNLQWSKHISKKILVRDALNYCQDFSEDGYRDWRLPTISELRTLIQNCVATETGGSCKITDLCLSPDTCYNEECDSCDDPNIQYSKLGDKGLFYSSSIINLDDLEGENENSSYLWYVDFNYGAIRGYSNSEKLVRCVRNKSNELDQTTDEEKSEQSEEEKSVNGNSLNDLTTKESQNGNNIEKLHWSDKAEEKMSLRDAVNYCENLSESGHENWRLPTISELRSLIQNCTATATDGSCGVTDECLFQDNCKNQECDGCDEKSVQYSKLGDKGLFWSSSLRPENRDNAWYIDFTYASIHGHSDGKKSVRCVR